MLLCVCLIVVFKSTPTQFCFTLCFTSKATLKTEGKEVKRPPKFAAVGQIFKMSFGKWQLSSRH